MYVTCAVGESSAVISIEDFADGMAPVMLINHCPLPIEYKQADTREYDSIQPHQIRPYTWSSVVEARKFIWKCGEFKMEDGLFKVRWRCG